VTARAISLGVEKTFAGCGIAWRGSGARSDTGSRLLQRHHVTSDGVRLLVRHFECGHASIRNAFEDQVAHGFLRRGTRTANVENAWAVSAAGSIFTVTADAEGLVLPLAGIRGLGGAEHGAESKSSGKRDGSHHGCLAGC